MTYGSEPGMTLKHIARKFGRSKRKLKELNGFKHDDIAPYTPVRVRKIYESAVYLPDSLALEQKENKMIFHDRFGVDVSKVVRLNDYETEQGLFYVRAGENIKEHDFSIKVFNPYGELVIESDKSRYEFDFKKEKEMYPLGIYTYVISGEYANGDEFEKLGHFKVILN